MGRSSSFRKIGDTGQQDFLEDLKPRVTETAQPITTRFPNPWIMDDLDLTPFERVALLRCWFLANKEARWPRNQKATWVTDFEAPTSLIAKGAMGPTTAKAAMAGLVKKGFLGKIKRPAGHASRYRFKDKARRSAFGKEGKT